MYRALCGGARHRATPSLLTFNHMRLDPIERLRHRMHKYGSIVGLSVLTLSCTVGGGDVPLPAGSSASSGQNGGDGPTAAALAGETSALDPSAPDFTSAPTTGAPQDAREGCQKVDFLYVVDNSASMVDEQINLTASFSGFMRVVQDTLGTMDHHIMVVDTDDRNVGDVVASLRGDVVLDDTCVGVLGAGLRSDLDGYDCGIAGGGRYMLDNQADLESTFACLAQVGTAGDATEQTIGALLSAVGPTLAGPDGCNAGFLREDAVLVVTLITDEEDDNSALSPEDWKRRLLAIKGGNEDAIVVLGLIADAGGSGALPGGPCPALDNVDSPRLQRFVQSFGFGSLGSVCAPEYSNFFAQAVSVVATACDVFVPPILR